MDFLVRDFGEEIDFADDQLSSRLIGVSIRANAFSISVIFLFSACRDFSSGKGSSPLCVVCVAIAARRRRFVAPEDAVLADFLLLDGCIVFYCALVLIRLSRN